MSSTIQEVFNRFYEPYCATYGISTDHNKVANAIKRCKTGALGYNVSACNECGHVEVHNNSCRNGTARIVRQFRRSYGLMPGNQR